MELRSENLGLQVTKLKQKTKDREGGPLSSHRQGWTASKSHHHLVQPLLEGEGGGPSGS